jgi:peroxiredoxin
MSVSASWCLRSGREFPMAAIGMIVLLALPGTGCTQRTQATSLPVTDEPPPQTARNVLDRVVEAYHRADSYQDSGRLVVRYTHDGETVSQASEFSLAVAGPNRLRMRALDALAVCDGQTFRATIDEAPGEVLSFAAPEELSPVHVYGEPVLGKAFNQIVGSVPLALFLDPNPLDGLLYNAQSPQLDSPEKLGSDLCYRVRIDRREGVFVLWIDQKDFVVRRVNYPPDGYRRLLEPVVGEITDMSITAEMDTAQLNPVIDDSTFQFEMPAGAEVVKRFDVFRVGSRIPKFKLRTLDGQVLTRESLADKIVVVKFWQADDVFTYLDELSGFEQIQKRYQDEDSLVFLAVSADHNDTPDDDLRAALERANLSSLRVARIDPQVSLRSFGMEWVPTTVIVGRDGTVQQYIDHADPDQAQTLPRKLDTLLAGGDLYLEAPEEVQDFMFFSALAWQNPPPSPDDDQQPALAAAMAKAEIAPASEPDALRKTRVWKCPPEAPAPSTAVKRPGNILVIPGDSGSDRVFVLDGSLSVAEIGPDGTMLGRHRLEIPYRDDSAVTFLRTAADATGHRYILGSKMGVQQLHLFDPEWKRLLSFPEDGSHPGISDATLADLDGDGKLEMLVGYLTAVGVHCVDLDGERLWRCHAAENVLRLAVTGPNREQRRQLLVAGDGAVQPIDSAGRGQPSIPLTGGAFVGLIFTADLNGDDVSEWCAIAFKSAGQNGPAANVAVGLSPDGAQQWTYPLPAGAHHHGALEMVTSGNLLGTAAGQWVIAGADGSIHLLDIDGGLIDRFNYGAAPSGMAIANINGRPALVVATDDSVQAWQFEAAGQETTGDGSR